jgi:hypothetical protein
MTTLGRAAPVVGKGGQIVAFRGRHRREVIGKYAGYHQSSHARTQDDSVFSCDR